MILTIIFCIISLIIGCGITYLVLKPQLEKVVQINTERIGQNIALEEKNRELRDTNTQLTMEINNLRDAQNSLQDDIRDATEQFSKLSSALEESSNSMFE